MPSYLRMGHHAYDDEDMACHGSDGRQNDGETSA
eukprot:CAMPEP_0206326806 /NCGR_PEP_ID=MMETSP0106_2-20121207/21811_1 /ASSEMBLY_ACC=CAM_ASM_000206 /TAXON_ID=81532 /ORGANISM="Acanthoeca-like sp., Strain 10tr" /LENGTH=33 /DNA_ID= /DNA_START= /DNA_END= /DNA_ORIENTATION=